VSVADGIESRGESVGQARADPLFSVRDLVTHFFLPEGVVHAVNGVSFDVMPGEAVGIVGETGSGKTVTVLTALGLVPQPPARVLAGEVLFKGQDLLSLGQAELRQILGREIGIVFQDAMTSLNPVFTVGEQLRETLEIHQPDLSRGEAKTRAIELLRRVGISNPTARYRQYPHEYSGGMSQRAMIAMAVANEAELIIADEPTTSLDVTIQAQVLEVLDEARRQSQASVVLITHDLGVIAERVDRVVVMYAGTVVEVGDVFSTFAKPRHPYTLGLLKSRPDLDRLTDRLGFIPGSPPVQVGESRGCPFQPRCALSLGRSLCLEERPPLVPATAGHVACHFWDEIEELGDLVGAEPASALRPASPGLEQRQAAKQASSDGLLDVRGLVVHYGGRQGIVRRARGGVRAVDGVDFRIEPAETLGLVGESGCGKSTIGKAVMRFLEPTGGTISFAGRDISHISKRDLRDLRDDVQIVFQDPFASLNPRMPIGEVVGEPLAMRHVRRAEVAARVDGLLEQVGLPRVIRGRFPHELSGGQRQRVAIARALAVSPRLLVLDEPLSALDVSVQAQVTNLLQTLQEELGLSYLFISHDLSVVHHLARRVAVMYLGRIVETGARESVFGHPLHPYTQGLLSAVPIADPAHRSSRSRILLEGDVPNPSDPPSGCHFRTRCWKAQAVCSVEDPALVARPGADHPVACHFPEPLAVVPAAQPAVHRESVPFSEPPGGAHER
jgi:peptide/nickel transport system ATP-binding protein